MPKTRTQATCEGHPRLMVWGFSASWMDFPRTEICCETSFYLLGDIRVFYTTPPLPDAVSILMNMQPFYSLKQGKKKSESSSHRDIKRHAWFRRQLESQLSHLLPITEADVPLAVNCCY